MNRHGESGFNISIYLHIKLLGVVGFKNKYLIVHEYFKLNFKLT